MSAPRNVVNSHSIFQDLGANDVLGSQRQDGLCTVEVGVPSFDQKERSIQTRRIGGVDGPLPSRGQKTLTASLTSYSSMRTLGSVVTFAQSRVRRP